MYPSTRARCSAVTSGPISVPGAAPSPIRRSRTFRSSASSNGRDSPTATSTLPARQRSPAAPNAELMMASTLFSTLASGIATRWFLAPPNACTRLPCAAAVWYTYFATGPDPTNEIARTSGCASRASTASRDPCSRLYTPAGRPASCNNSAARVGVSGTFSDGFRMNVLPQAMAKGYIHIGTMAGKLNGVMPAHTPSGWRMVWQSMPFETFSDLDERVAAGDGEGIHPHRHHGRKVERRDARAHAQRLADGLAIDALRDVFKRMAHHQAGHPAGYFHHLYGAANAPGGVVQGLAVLSRKDAGDLTSVLFQQILVAIKHLHALHDRHFPPLQESGVRGACGAVHIVRVGVGNLRNHFASGRVRDRMQTAPGRVFPVSVCVELYRTGHGESIILRNARF